MKKLFASILLLLTLSMSCFAVEAKLTAEAARSFPRPNQPAAELLIYGRATIKLFASSESGASAFDRVQFMADAINSIVQSGLDPASIEPAMINNLAVGMVGDFPVFVVEKKDLINTKVPPLLISYDWCNRIRSAFGAPLLDQAIVDEIVRLEKTRGNIIEVKRKKWDEGSDIVINGKIVMTVKDPYNETDSYKKAHDMAMTLEQSIVDGEKGYNILPGYLFGNNYTINVGREIIDVSTADVKSQSKVKLWNYTVDVVNKMRGALGASPFSPKFLYDKLTQFGKASWYGGFFHGRRTSSGERYDMNEFTAAHKELPFGTMVLVTRLDNSKSVAVKITDRGPFVRGRIIDLSRSAADSLGMLGKGVASVKIQIIGRAPLNIYRFRRKHVN